MIHTVLLALLGVLSALPAWAVETRHPNADYFHYMLIDSVDPELCRGFGARFSADLAKVGEVDGWDATRYVEFRDSGPTERTASVKMPDFKKVKYFYVTQVIGGVNGGLTYDEKLAHYRFDPDKPLGPDNGVPETLLEPDALARYVETIDPTNARRMPQGYRTYASIHMFIDSGRLFVIADGRRGMGSGARIGERSFSGVYEVFDDNHVERRCLFETYEQSPAADNRLEAGKRVGAFFQTLQTAYCCPPELGRIWPIMNEFIASVDYDASVFPRRLLWEQQQSDAPDIRRKHDDNLDYLARWSAEGIKQKRLFREVLAQFPPALDEATTYYVEQHKLSRRDARAAAELTLMQHIDWKIGRYAGSSKPPANPVSAQAYKPRYKVAPKEAEILPKVADLRSGIRAGLPVKRLATLLAATPDKGDSGPESVLMAALDQPGALRLLLDGGADPNYRNPFGKTPVMVAAQLDLPNAVAALVANGADVNARTIALPADPEKRRDHQPYNVTIGGRTALMYAAGQASGRTIQLLLDQGADPSVVDDKGRSVVDYLSDNTALEKRDLDRLKARIDAAKP